MEPGSALCDLGRHREAIALLGEVVASDPDNPRAWCLMARAQLGDKQNRYLELAYARLATSDLDGARTAVSRALELDPDQPETHIASARVAVNAGRGSEAKTSFGARWPRP